jgi:hypothetical protein
VLAAAYSSCRDCTFGRQIEKHSERCSVRVGRGHIEVDVERVTKWGLKLAGEIHTGAVLVWRHNTLIKGAWSYGVPFSGALASIKRFA